MRNIRVTYIRKIFFILHLLLMTGTDTRSLISSRHDNKTKIDFIDHYVCNEQLVYIFYFVLNMVIKSVFHKS